MGAIIQQVGRLDEAWMLGLATRRVPRWLDHAFRGLTHLGGATATIAIGLALAAFPATRLIGLTALVANTLSHAASQILKRRFVRRRPHLVVAALRPLIPIPDAYSFPSGHSAAAVSVALSIALNASLLIAVPIIAMALLVAASRVYLRVHFVTDVVMGSLLGAAGTGVAMTIVG
jgi:undecaprenyl-diphosphatase